MEIIKKEGCKHEYNLIAGNPEGSSWLFYCKFCLDFQLRGIQHEGEDKAK